MNPKMSHFKEDLTSSALNTSVSKGEARNTPDSEARLKQEDMTDTSKPRLSKENSTRNAESKTNERDGWATNTLSLFKEDLSLFADDVTNAFKLSLLKENDGRIAGSGTMRPRQRDALSLFKEDFTIFKEELSSVFKIGLSKEKDIEKGSAVKTGSSKEAFGDVFKMNVCSNESGKRTATFLRLSQPPETHRATDAVDAAKNRHSNVRMTEGPTASETEDKMRYSFVDPLWDIQTERGAAASVVGLSKEDLLTDVLKSGSLEDKERKAADSTADSEGRAGRGDGPVVLREGLTTEKREETEENSFRSLPRETTVLRKSLSEEDPHNEVINGRPGGEFWTVKNYACYLTLDPNTANREVHLSDDNRSATRGWPEHLYPDHPEQFQRCPQALCREGLLGRVYWELEWAGGADVGVAYSSLSRDGDVGGCLLGHNDRSWSLECSEDGSYTPCHDNRRCRASSPVPFSHRVGVYLDWAGGTLSFYNVSPDVMVHLHTFHETFDQPLYPAFWLWAYDGSVTLRQVELEWERLLQ